MSHLTFYFHVSPVIWTITEVRRQRKSMPSLFPNRFTIKTQCQGNGKGTANKGDRSPDMGDTCCVHPLDTQGKETSCVSLGFPCPRDRQHPRLSLRMEPEPWPGDLVGPDPGSPGREKSLQGHRPSHTGPLFPISSRGGSSHQPG